MMALGLVFLWHFQVYKQVALFRMPPCGSFFLWFAYFVTFQCVSFFPSGKDESDGLRAPSMLVL